SWSVMIPGFTGGPCAAGAAGYWPSLARHPKTVIRRTARGSAMIATITMPRLLYIGGGAVAEVATVRGRLGASRPLVVTDRFIESSGILARVTDRLDGAQIPWQVFADTVPDPTTDVVET